MVIVEIIFMGPLYDTFGRKIPIVLGFLATGASIIVIPLCSTMFPAFLILRCVLSLGTSIGLNCPLLPDYVSNKSMGLANGIGQVVISFAFIFSSSGLLTIAKNTENQSLIYYWTGSAIIGIAIFLSYGIKDVIDDKEIQTITGDP